MSGYTTQIANVRAKLRTDPGKKIITDAVIGLFLNDGQRIVERKADWPFAEVTRSFSTSTGSQEYTLSVVLREVTVVTYEDRTTPLEPMDYKDSKVYGTSSGTPFAFYLKGAKTIGFVNIPADVSDVQVSGIRVFPEMTSATASIIPIQDLDILETFALGQCYKTLNQVDRGNNKLGEFYDGLERMEEEHAMRVPGGDYRVKDPEDYVDTPNNTFNYNA